MSKKKDLNLLKDLINEGKFVVRTSKAIYVSNKGALVGFSLSYWKHLSTQEREKCIISKDGLTHGDRFYP